MATLLGFKYVLFSYIDPLRKYVVYREISSSSSNLLELPGLYEIVGPVMVSIYA